MILEQTNSNPPIDFEWYLTGPQGARFILYPVKGQHSEEDVKRARQSLYREQDVVSMQVRWVKAGDNTPPPEKIPEYIINKELKREIGEKESYIQELEDNAQKDNVVQRRQLKKEIQSEELYKQLKSENTKLKKENQNLRGTISDLITKLNSK
jgi:hypothetical protein